MLITVAKGKPATSFTEAQPRRFGTESLSDLRESVTISLGYLLRGNYRGHRFDMLLFDANDLLKLFKYNVVFLNKLVTSVTYLLT